MSRAKDEEVRSPGVVPREHFVRPLGLRGRKKYPLKAMIVGDFFVLHSWDDALAIRAAIRSFHKRSPGRSFTVRQREAGVWVCRRVA